MIIINLDKAKDIWKNKLREQRSYLFPVLDIAFLKSLENNDIYEQKRISELKQALRDATDDPRIQNASSIEYLQTINPINELGI